MPKKLTTQEFIERANLQHNNKFDYSLMEYKRLGQKIKIICPDHGPFEQIAYDHLNAMFGCRRCSGHKAVDAKEFIKQSSKIHNNKFDYSLVNYKHSKSKVKIICPIHDVFEQIPYHHMNGIGCPSCSQKKKKNTKIFIKEAREVHGDIYDYSLVKYKNTCSNVTIICSIHGEFEQIARYHLNGSKCPECRPTRGESLIKSFLENNNISFESQFKFDDCVYKDKLVFDYYIPSLNTIIEFDGPQHYKPVKYFGGQKTFETIKKRDKIKNNYCFDNNIRLIRIPYRKMKEINKILKNALL